MTKFTDFQDIFKFLRENVDFDLDGNSSKTERAIGDPLVAKLQNFGDFLDFQYYFFNF